jgi:hypothetical protein
VVAASRDRAAAIRELLRDPANVDELERQRPSLCVVTGVPDPDTGSSCR